MKYLIIVVVLGAAFGAGLQFLSGEWKLSKANADDDEACGKWACGSAAQAEQAEQAERAKVERERPASGIPATPRSIDQCRECYWNQWVQLDEWKMSWSMGGLRNPRRRATLPDDWKYFPGMASALEQVDPDCDFVALHYAVTVIGCLSERERSRIEGMARADKNMWGVPTNADLLCYVRPINHGKLEYAVMTHCRAVRIPMQLQRARDNVRRAFHDWSHF